MVNVFTRRTRVTELVNQVGMFHVEIVVLARINPVKEDALTRSIHSCVWDTLGRRHVFLYKRLEIERRIAKMDLMKQQVVSRDGDAMEF